MSNNPAPRAPVYGPIHKLHRYSSAVAIMRLGATNFGNEHEARAAVELIRGEIAFGRAHLRNEDRHVHPLVRAIAGDTEASLASGHDEHERAFEELDALATRIEIASGPERVALGTELYLAFARFVAHDFLHLDFEERVVEPLIHEHYSDRDIERSHAQVIEETSAAEMERLRELAPHALNKPELDAVAALLEAPTANAA